MATLVARLSGPVQAWGAEPTLRTATTHTTPTWSALLGLCRAALGHGRRDPQDDIAWLRQLDMAVRCDATGSVRVDFHTVNPLPVGYDRFEWLEAGDRGLVPLGTSVQSSGQAPRWLKGTAPMVTRRHLVQDASFLWLVHGADQDVDRLAQALSRPRWQLALGRKSCTPSSPVLLGVHPGTVGDVAAAAPSTAAAVRPARQATTGHPAGNAADTPGGRVELVWLHGHPGPQVPVQRTRVVLDVPLGSHPQHGHAAGQHSVVELPAPPADDLLAWSSAHLTHPDRPADAKDAA